MHMDTIGGFNDTGTIVLAIIPTGSDPANEHTAVTELGDFLRAATPIFALLAALCSFIDLTLTCWVVRRGGVDIPDHESAVLG